MAVKTIDEILDDIREESKKEELDTKRLNELGKNLMEMSIFALMNRSNNFYGTLLSNVVKDVTLKLEAAAAVSHRDNRFYLHLNPLLMAAMAKNERNVVAIIEHEAYHLMNLHLIIYREMMKNGKGKIMNIGTDCYINQNIPDIPESAVTVEYVEELTGLNNIDRNRESQYYIKLLLDNYKENNMTFNLKDLLERMRERKKMSEEEREESQKQNEDMKKAVEELISDIKEDKRDGNNNGMTEELEDQMDKTKDELDNNEDDSKQDKKDDLSDSIDNSQENPSQPNKNDTQDKAEKLLKDIRLDELADQTLNGEPMDIKPENGEGIEPGHDTWDTSGLDDNEVEDLKNDLKGLIEDSINNSRGTTPAGATEALERLSKPSKMNWKQYLRKKTGSARSGKKKTILRANRRQPFRHDLRGDLPGRKIGRVIAAIDTSGSMSNRVLSEIINEVRVIVTKDKIACDVIFFDSEVAKVVEIRKASDIKYEAWGRGGTVFQPVFDYLKEDPENVKYNKKEDVILFFSDGYGESRVDTHGFNDVIWVITDNGNLSVNDPVGKVIELLT